MSDIKSIISLLSPSEQQLFIKHLKHRNKRKDTKNVALFKALSAEKEKSLEKDMGSNAYRALKKRLQDTLLDFIAGLTLESEATAETSIIKQILIARKLLNYEQYKTAFKILRSSEQQAKQIQHYSLLNEIYHTWIEYSYREEVGDQEVLFNAFHKNQEELLAQEKLNMAYAIVKKAFLDSERRTEKVELKKLLKQTYANLGISKKQGYNLKTLYQLAEIVDIEGSYNKDYYSVDLFFVDALSQLDEQQLQLETTLLYYIDLLYLIANIYFRKKQFDQSIAFLNKMKTQMLQYNAKYLAQRECRHRNLLALNLNFCGKATEAIQLIESPVNPKETAENDLLNGMLIKVMLYFQQKQLKKAKEVLSQLQHTDSFYERTVGLEWTLNKKYIEILLHIELEDIDYVDSRMQSLVRTHGNYFKSKKEFQVLPFLKIVKQYYHQPALVDSEDFLKHIEESIHWKPKYQEDIFLMCFYAWMKSKIVKQPLYAVTLELINQDNFSS